MPIKVKCGSCGAGFSAKDSLAGKHVKCPKCSAGIQIPTAAGAGSLGSAPGGTKSAGRAAAVSSTARQNVGTMAGNLGDPLADLLDEVGVKGVVSGSACPSCEAPITAGARICINCGYNFETGTHLQTLAYEDGADELAGMTETEKMLWKAEQEIDDMPISGEGQDFGDGASAYVVAGGVALVAITIAATGLLITMGLQQMADAQGSAQMAQVASALFFLVGHVWMIIAAFMKEPKFGVMCVFIPFFSLIYACLHRYWFAVFMMVVGAVVYMGASAYIANSTPGYGG